jgi:hypothetical protein
VPASVTGPVRGPRSVSTSRRLRVAGRSVPARPVTAWVRGTLSCGASEPTWVWRGLAMLNRLPLTRDASSRLLLGLRPRSAVLVKERIATAAPALSLLQRRQLLGLAEQAARAALLGTPSLVVGHDRKLSADAVPQARRWWAVRTWTTRASRKPASRPARQGARGVRAAVPTMTKRPPKMRMRGLEPPPSCLDTDLNREQPKHMRPRASRSSVLCGFADASDA